MKRRLLTGPKDEYGNGETVPNSFKWVGELDDLNEAGEEIFPQVVKTVKVLGPNMGREFIVHTVPAYRNEFIGGTFTWLDEVVDTPKFIEEESIESENTDVSLQSGDDEEEDDLT